MRRPWSGSRLATLLALCAIATACESNGVEGGLDFERMVVQPKGDPYDPSPLFADSMVMRHPPEGTVPHVVDLPEPVVRTGRRNGTWVARAPMGYPPAMLERGRDRFTVYCAPCHGHDGLAATPIASAMELRRPPPLTSPYIQALPDGRIFQVVGEGYGLMPGYGYQLPVHDRWAVVAYVRALQLMYRVPLDSLPAPERARLLQRLGDPGLIATDSAGGGS